MVWLALCGHIKFKWDHVYVKKMMIMHVPQNIINILQ